MHIQIQKRPLRNAGLRDAPSFVRRLEKPDLLGGVARLPLGLVDQPLPLPGGSRQQDALMFSVADAGWLVYANRH